MRRTPRSNHRAIFRLVRRLGGTLIFCLGSLQAYRERASNRITRDIELNSAPEASLVYDRHNNVVFSFASEDRTNVPLERSVEHDGVGRARRRRSSLSQATRAWISSGSLARPG